MAILKVARMGHPVLRQVARPVGEDALGSPEIRALVEDMVETMEECDGVGLAAPQVHVSRRIVVIRTSEEEPEGGHAGALVLINPETRPLSEAMVTDWEGCLSIPDVRGQVPRPKAIAVEALSADGEALGFEVRGRAARIVQHEVDHLDGILFPDRMEDLKSLMFLEEYVRYGET